MREDFGGNHRHKQNKDFNGAFPQQMLKLAFSQSPLLHWTAMPEETPDLEYEYRKQRYEAYLAERDTIRKESLELSGRYDKAILALAGGALALSITFLEKIAPHPFPWTFVFLAGAWLCLIASVLLELYALSTSQTITNEQIGVADEEYRQYLSTLENPPPLPNPAQPPHSREVIENGKQRMEQFNNWSRWLLTLGVALLCTFSLLNLPYSDKNHQEGENAMPPAVKPINESKGSFAVPANALPPPPPPRPTTPTPKARPASPPPSAVPAPNSSS